MEDLMVPCLLSDCSNVTFSLWLSLSEPQFPCLWNGDDGNSLESSMID